MLIIDVELKDASRKIGEMVEDLANDMLKPLEPLNEGIKSFNLPKVFAEYEKLETAITTLAKNTMADIAEANEKLAKNIEQTESAFQM